jgi:LysR family hydrogen peroxide-inducible transcriptional activator
MPGGMQFQHIRYFLALADEANFTRAAKRCGVSQPSLTNAIKSLELLLDGALFERNSKGCCLTDFGTALRPHFEQLHRHSEQVIRLAKHFSTKTRPACARGVFVST